jgi:uncharacterized protein (DUF1697 family)
MALVVFMRGVNVGGHKTFKPAALARELAEFDVVNIGAAGTFVVRRPIAEAALRRELIRRLPFDAELMICRAAEVISAAHADPFPRALPKETKRFVSILSKKPRTLPALPIDMPTGPRWQVRIVAIVGRFAISLQRPGPSSSIYANEVVERHVNVSATTRNWNTIEAICRVLESG